MELSNKFVAGALVVFVILLVAVKRLYDENIRLTVRQEDAAGGAPEPGGAPAPEPAPAPQDGLEAKE